MLADHPIGVLLHMVGTSKPVVTFVRNHAEHVSSPCNPLVAPARVVMSRAILIHTEKFEQSIDLGDHREPDFASS
jgi:hypothetical protein